MSEIKLLGRVFINANILVVTGLQIGGSGSGLEIGDIDKWVIRNPLNNRPYIPGSSLRGKMRSQTEKKLGLPQNNLVGQATIHTCKKPEEYQKNGGCPVCIVFGVPASSEAAFSQPSRLVVRDALLSDDSAKDLDNANTELRFAEIKTEVTIDRVTSAATPRTIERVPAGALFGPTELVFNIYEKADYNRLKTVIEAMQLVEDDYLGGGGSRGSGKIRFTDIEILARASENYSKPIQFDKFDTIQALADSFAHFQKWLAENVPAE